MRFDPGSTAVLAIDFQNSFCADDGSMARQDRDIGPMKQAALHAATLVRAARSAGLPILWTTITFNDDYSDGGLLIHEYRPGLARIGALRRGSHDAALLDALPREAADAVIDKQRFSSFHGTRLGPLLESQGIANLIVCGVTTSMCVETTVRDAGQRDYRVWVVEDACGDFDSARHDASLDAMRFGFAHSVRLDAVLTALRALEPSGVAVTRSRPGPSLPAQ